MFCCCDSVCVPVARQPGFKINWLFLTVKLFVFNAFHRTDASAAVYFNGLALLQAMDAVWNWRGSGGDSGYGDGTGKNFFFFFFCDRQVRQHIDEVANEILTQSSSLNMFPWHHVRFCTDKETITDTVRHLNVCFLWFRCLTKQEPLSPSLYVPNTHTHTHTHTLTHTVAPGMACGAQVSGHSPLLSVCGADRLSANLWPPSVSH